MGAYYLYNRVTDVNEAQVIKHFKTIGIGKYFSFELGNYKLLLFNKALIDENNFLSEHNHSIFVTGSLVYKNLGYKNSIIQLLRDFTNNQINTNSLYGNYTIIFFNNITKKITLLFDPLFFKNNYIDFKNNVIASNFLSIIDSRPYNYSLNKMALYESVVTGALIPPDTYANGVERICNLNFSKIEQKFNNISVYRYHLTTHPSFNSKKKAIHHVTDLLNSYFHAMQNLDMEYNSHIGLTGGFDSRLLFIFAKRHLKNLNANSFYRKDSLEFEIAKELARISGVDFVSYENNCMPNKTFIDKDLTLRFLDGQVRSQNYIHEPFSHPQYGMGLYRNHLIGFHGCGGEQFRNADRLKGTINFRNYLLNEWFYRFGTDVISDKKLSDEIFENIYTKTKNLLNISGTKQDILTVKRFQNEVYNPSNRLTRVNALNQQLFYFAPFTEWQLSVSSYSLIPILGSTQEFQVQLMKSLNDIVNSIQTAYGFSINDGLPFSQKLIEQFLTKLPRKYIIRAYRKYKYIKKKNFRTEIEWSENYRNIINKLNLKYCSLNSDLSGNIIAMRTLLEQLKLTNKNE